MPLYEFKCIRGHRSERLVPVGTKQIFCPACEKEKKGGTFVAHKVISVPAPPHFSGHGWTPPKLERKG